MSTEKERVVFIVVDPSQDRPLALERAIKTAQEVPKDELEKLGLGVTRLHIFMAVDFDNTDTSADNPAVYRDTDWLFERVVNPLRESGIEGKLELSWSSDWYGSILAAAEKLQPEMIMLPMISKPTDRDRFFNDSVWRLLRTSTCPVLLSQPGNDNERSVVLAAVNFQSHKPEYQELNEKILTRARFVARISGADLHIVNAYKDSLQYPDRAKLASQTQVDTSKIHVRVGEPDVVIAEVAKELDANMVMLGVRGRGSRWRGNTSERILNKVDSDIYTIN